MKNILFIGAHFDDTDLAAAGTCAKWVSEGKKVYKLVLTDNVTNFSQKNIVVDYDSSKTTNDLVCKMLGIDSVIFDPIPCNKLTYDVNTMQRIERIIFDLNIDTVVIHSDGDFNQDHNSAFTLCTTAARHCDNILCYGSNGYSRTKQFMPNFFVDITEFIDIKKKVLSLYSVEHNRFGRLFDVAISRNQVWGYSCNCGYAEAFEIIKLKV